MPKPSTESTYVTESQNPTTIAKLKSKGVKVGMPVDDLACPKCPAMNRPGVAYIWEVTDERGKHYECNMCSHAWR